MPDKMVANIDRGAELDADRFSATSRVELLGHVTLVQGYNLASYVGCHALLELRDSPGESAAVITSEPRLQSLLEAALASGSLIAVWGHKLKDPSAPLGGTWTVDVYTVDSVILYNMK